MTEKTESRYLPSTIPGTRTCPGNLTQVEDESKNQKIASSIGDIKNCLRADYRLITDKKMKS